MFPPDTNNESAGKPLVIGISGGIASGKSVVAGQLCSLGASVLDADAAGHRVLHDPEVKQQLVARWGDRVLQDDGSLSRKQIAAIVFAEAPQAAYELQFLEKITHPRIGKLLQQQIQSQTGTATRVLVLDAAVMFKGGWDRFCDFVIFVDTPQPARLERALERGWTAEQFHAREAVQLPVEEKRRRADYIIDNSGPLADTRQQTELFWQRFVEPYRATHPETT